jgi:hypothetical protein
MTTDAGSEFDKLAAGRDAGEEDPEEELERKHSHDSVNDAF